MTLVETLQNGIQSVIDSAFPDIPIYADPVEQGFNRPSFSIKCIDTNLTPDVKSRFIYGNMFSIIYHPAKFDYSDIAEKREILSYLLLEVPFGSKVARCRKPNTNISDETLVFVANYEYMVKTEEIPEPLMKTLSINQGLK